MFRITSFAIPSSFKNLPAHGDDFGVGQRCAGPQQFGADLVELAVAAFLRALVAEHRAGVENFLRQRLGKAGGDERAADAGRAFRAQSDGIAAAVFKGVHFLGHDIGRFTQRAGEDAGVFKNRGLPFRKTVKRGDFAGGFHDMEMPGGVIANEVTGATDGLEWGGHFGGLYGLNTGRGDGIAGFGRPLMLVGKNLAGAFHVRAGVFGRGGGVNFGLNFGR